MSGTLARSSSVMTTYWSFAYSKPLTVSAREITSSWNGQNVFIWMRFRQLSWSMLNAIPFESVAR